MTIVALLNDGADLDPVAADALEEEFVGEDRNKDPELSLLLS